MSTKSEPEPADAVAFLRAQLAGDMDGVRCLYEAVDRERLVTRAIELLVGIMDIRGGTLTLDRALVAWQQQNVTGSER